MSSVTEHQAPAAAPSHGPDWDAAIAFGIDVTLLERNLALTVEERLEQLRTMDELFQLLRPAGPSDDAEHP
jgi:hypothetical protein